MAPVWLLFGQTPRAIFVPDATFGGLRTGVDKNTLSFAPSREHGF